MAFTILVLFPYLEETSQVQKANNSTHFTNIDCVKQGILYQKHEKYKVTDC